MKGYYKKGGLFALLASFLMSPVPSCSRRSGKNISFTLLSPSCQLSGGNLQYMKDRSKDELANFKVTITQGDLTQGDLWIFGGCEISDARLSGSNSDNFFINSIFVNSVFRNVTMGPGTRLIAIGGVIKDSEIMGLVRFGDKKAIRMPLLGTEYLNRVSGAETAIKEIFKTLGYKPPKMTNTTINSGYKSYYTLLRDVEFKRVKILKWCSGKGVEPSIYGCSGQMPNLRETKFSDSTGAQYINLGKGINNYPQYVPNKIINTLSGGKVLTYCVKKANVNSKFMFSDKSVQSFIKMFNLLLGRFGIVAIDENEYRVAGLKEEPYGNITLSKPLKEGYLGAVNRIETLSQDIAIELKYDFLNIVTHEIAHALGGTHPWKDEAFWSTSLSTLKPNPDVSNLNSFGPSDIKFLFALMNIANRTVNKVTEVVNDYFDNSAKNFYLYFPGDQNKECSNIVYNSEKDIAENDFGAISEAQLRKLCGYKKEICPDDVQIYKFKNEGGPEIYLLLPIDKCWKVNISDRNRNSKIIYVPIGGEENGQEEKGANYSFLPLILLMSLYAAVNLFHCSKKLFPARRVHNAEAEMFSTRSRQEGSRGVNI